MNFVRRSIFKYHSYRCVFSCQSTREDYDEWSPVYGILLFITTISFREVDLLGTPENLKTDNGRQQNKLSRSESGVSPCRRITAKCSPRLLPHTVYRMQNVPRASISWRLPSHEAVQHKTRDTFTHYSHDYQTAGPHPRSSLPSLLHMTEQLYSLSSFSFFEEEPLVKYQ